MDTKDLLLQFSARNGVAGAEDEAARYACGQLAPFGTPTVSPLGSVVCAIREPVGSRPHIMLDAHIDEIGMIVTHIGEKGFLSVGACGGIDRRLLLASPVTVHAGKASVNGVVCSVPPHLSKENEKNKRVEEIYIDIGANTQAEAAALVEPGDRVTIKSASHALLNGLVSGKAMDNRAGCASILKAVEYLAGEILDCGLTVVFSSMEEVGGSGARTAAYSVSPTHALVVDVSFAYTPDSEKKNCGDLKGGPMIGFAPILDHTLSRTLCRLAEENGIAFQREVMGGKTGTNADSIATSRGGIKTALVSVPQKYMHTPIETVAVEDVENTAKLLAACVKEIAKGEAGHG